MTKIGEEQSLGKAALEAPLYISVAWILMISYQMFTQTAVLTLVTYINMFWPFAGAWLTSRVDMITFVSAFAWIFVLSSVIPSAILGKERGVIIQFFVCLASTFLAFIAFDVLEAYKIGPVNYLLSFVVLLNNPFLAIAYLSIPYVIMLALDLRARRLRNKKKLLEHVTNSYIENAVAAEEKSIGSEQP